MDQDISKLLDEITDEEINSLECPTYSEQEEAWQQVLKNVNVPNIESLLDSIGYELISMKSFDDSKGMMSKIHFLVVKLKQTSLEKEMVLRISSPHKFWEKLRCQNEVAILKYVKTSTNIPVPTVYSYSTDKSTSHLGCEYILMEKLTGVILDELLSKIKSVDETPHLIIDQILGFIKDLLHVNPPKMDKNLIGLFDMDMRIGPARHGGALIDPCETFFEYIDPQLKWCAKEIKKLKIYESLAGDLETMRRELAQIVEANPDLDGLNFGDEMTVFHGDPNNSNILIDPENNEITGLIDWEYCIHGYGFNDLNLYFHYWIVNHKNYAAILKAIKENNSPVKRELIEWLETAQKGSQFRKYFQKLALTSNNMVFYCSSWFYRDSSDPAVKVRLHFRRKAEKLRKCLDEWPEMRLKIKNYRNKTTDDFIN